jgi:hypothetical protein
VPTPAATLDIHFDKAAVKARSHNTSRLNHAPMPDPEISKKGGGAPESGKNFRYFVSEILSFTSIQW